MAAKKTVGELAIKVTANSSQFSNTLEKAADDVQRFRKAAGGAGQVPAGIPDGVAAAGVGVPAQAAQDAGGFPRQQDEHMIGGGITIGNVMKIAAFFKIFEMADVFAKEIGAAAVGAKSFEEAIRTAALDAAQMIPIVGGVLKGAADKLGINPQDSTYKPAPQMTEARAQAMIAANKVGAQLDRGEADRKNAAQINLLLKLGTEAVNVILKTERGRQQVIDLVAKAANATLAL